MMEAPTKIAEVDFRFAGPEDTAEIVTLVNDAFSVEKGGSGLAFTTRDRVSKEEVDACLHGACAEKRWLVLETPHPEETMVAACLICAGTTPGKGSVELLAVEPARQGRGLGSHLLRRAEGILLNFRCRFVRMRVPQWREDVLGWVGKRGYKETGGGVWGELDGESAEGLTRPTRYFMLTHDLLTDEKVAGTFGDGTTRFTAAAAAAAERVALGSTRKPTSKPASSEASRGLDGNNTVQSKDEEDSGRLAGFLSSVLKGLADAEVEDQDGIDAKDVAAAPMADMSVGAEAATPSCPLQYPAPSDGTGASEGATCQPCAGTTTNISTAAPGEDGSVPASRNDFEVVELPSVGGGGDEAADGEESVEDLLGSLMRTLNTEQGRADFRRLAAAGSTS
ncbi:acetyltransferase [Ectocarpus siliculosus]|uniref:Acetyltransferase n=1 Tax=Ectocarpus siliculosus TaxID=2880 RepID=D7G8R9_ECTSI|nr:acetyltransferase [Ectocarpus siliculosus]|eukprot:CBJ28093.1 acetyltransferase [Ectocarpus siliculosus]